MYERIRTQKQINMTLEQFKKYEVPEGWKLMYVNGSEKYGWPGSLDTYFDMHVTIEEINNGI